MCPIPKTLPETIPPPKSAEELFKSKQMRTMWFTGLRCLKCSDMLYTDGVKVWCGNKCNEKGTYEVFQEEYIK
jgi:hypothetical protein